MKKITFKDYYQNLRNERVEFIKTIQKITGKSERSVYNWISGRQKPKKNSLKAICDYFQTDEETLFPSHSKTEQTEI
jgi:transcriptional regulator with XRE-family HTH domain